MSAEPERYVLYDGDCPACAHYVAASGLAQRKDVTLLDARNEPDLVVQHGAAGRSIDDGIVVKLDDTVHFGADATRAIAGLAQPQTAWARFLVWFVGNSPWARPLYPALAAGRRLLLRVLGRSLIGSGAAERRP